MNTDDARALIDSWATATFAAGSADPLNAGSRPQGQNAAIGAMRRGLEELIPDGTGAAIQPAGEEAPLVAVVAGATLYMLRFLPYAEGNIDARIAIEMQSLDRATGHRITAIVRTEPGISGIEQITTWTFELLGRASLIFEAREGEAADAFARALAAGLGTPLAGSS